MTRWQKQRQKPRDRRYQQQILGNGPSLPLRPQRADDASDVEVENGLNSADGENEESADEVGNDLAQASRGLSLGKNQSVPSTS